MTIIKRLRIENGYNPTKLEKLEEIVEGRLEVVADRYEGHDGMRINEEGQLVIDWTQESRDLDAHLTMDLLIEDDFFEELTQELRTEAPELF